MTLTIIRYFYFLLVIVTPILVFPHTSELFEFNKMLYIYFTSLCVGFLWLYYQIQSGKIQIRAHPFFLVLGIFLATQILSTVTSIDVHTSIFGYYGRFNAGLFSLFCYAILAFVFIQVADRGFIRRFFQVAFATAAVVVLIGLPGRFGADVLCYIFTGQLTNACWSDQFRPSERMFSTLGQPNWLGAYLAIMAFTGLALSLEQARRTGVFVYAAGITLCLLGILFTRSRSALLAVALCAAAAGVVLLLRHRKAVISRWKTYAVVGAVFVSAVIVFKTGIGSIDRFLNFSHLSGGSSPSIQSPAAGKGAAAQPSGVTDSFDIRRIVWRGAVDLGLQYPLFGTGVETFAYAYYFTRPLAHNMTSEWDFLYNKAHNEFLNYFATTGFPGVISYIAMILAAAAVFAFRYVKEQSEAEALFWLMLLFAYATISVTNFFGFSISSVQIFFYLLPAAAIAGTRGHMEWVSQLPRSRWFLVPSRIAVVVCVIFGAVYLARYFLADTAYASAESLQRAGEYRDAFAVYQQALALKDEHIYQDKLSSNLANLAYLLSFGEEADLASQTRLLSERLNKIALERSPKNVQYWRTRAKNAYLAYQSTLDTAYLNSAIESMKTAQSLAPTDPKMPYSTALFYALAADEADATTSASYHERALEEVNRSLKLKPDYTDALELRKQLLKPKSKTGEE